MKDGHSKMTNFNYSEIKMQDYMKSRTIKLKDALNIFQFRTCMAKFGENYRAGADFILCPLCLEDLDNQQHSFKCKILIKEIEIKGEILNNYSDNVLKETTETITKIVNLRKKLLDKNDII